MVRIKGRELNCHAYMAAWQHGNMTAITVVALGLYGIRCLQLSPRGKGDHPGLVLLLFSHVLRAGPLGAIRDPCPFSRHSSEAQ